MEGNTDTRPIVTVVTPCYKSEKYLYEAINSVLKQTYPKIEYIVTDDGTKNFPYEKVKTYIEDNKNSNIISFKVIKHKENIGTVKNMNNAYKQAKGEILMPLSADDIFVNENVVGKIVERMVKENNNILIGRRIMCDEKLNPIRRMPCEGYIKIINSWNTAEKQYKAFVIKEYYEMLSGSVMYLKKNFFEAMGCFDEKYRLWEDGPFWAKCSINGYKINTAYDIDSIFYRNSGVSGKDINSKSKNKLMIDQVECNSKLMLRKKDKASFIEKRKKEYLNKSYKNKCNKLIVKIMFIDIIIRQLILKLLRIYYVEKDKRKIKVEYCKSWRNSICK